MDRPTVPFEAPHARGRPLSRYLVIGSVAVAVLWGTTLAVTATQPGARGLLPTALAMTVTATMGLIGLGSVLYLDRRFAARTRLTQTTLNTVLCELAEVRGALAALRRQQNHREWQDFAEKITADVEVNAAEMRQASGAEIRQVIPFGRARGRRD